MRSSVDFWYFLQKTRQREGARGINGDNHLISLRATVPGLNRCAFLTPPVMGALLRADVATGTFLGARPPVDARAHCLVLRQLASAR